MTVTGCYVYVELGSSAVECPTRNQHSPGFDYPLCYHFKVWAFFTQLYKLLPTVDSGGNVGDYSSRVIAAWLECFPEKLSWSRNEQVWQAYRPLSGPTDWILRYIETCLYLACSYPCRWGGVAEGKPVVAGLEAFGHRVLANLSNAIATLCPPDVSM